MVAIPLEPGQRISTLAQNLLENFPGELLIWRTISKCDRKDQAIKQAKSVKKLYFRSIWSCTTLTKNSQRTYFAWTQNSGSPKHFKSSLEVMLKLMLFCCDSQQLIYAKKKRKRRNTWKMRIKKYIGFHCFLFLLILLSVNISSLSLSGVTACAFQLYIACCILQFC